MTGFLRALGAVASALACLASATVRADPASPLPRGTPAEVGLSAERLDRLTAVLKADVDAGLMPGIVALVARHGKVAYLETIGRRDPAGPAPMTADTIFRIYSMSKPIASVAAMMLVEEGRIGLDDPVSKYIPAFADLKVATSRPTGGGGNGGGEPEIAPARRPPTVQDLLRHTSGLTYGFFGEGPAKKGYLAANVTKGDFDNAEFAERLARLPLAYQPGTTWDYSHSTDVLGRVVEVASGLSLYAFEKARLLDPLGMADTSFTVPEPERQSRIAEPFPNDRSFGADASLRALVRTSTISGSPSPS